MNRLGQNDFSRSQLPMISLVNAAFVAKMRSDRFSKANPPPEYDAVRGRDLNRLLTIHAANSAYLERRRAAEARGSGAMSINDLPALSVLRTKMQWHQERQRVLAENVSNSDTPEFQAARPGRTEIRRHGRHCRGIDGIAGDDAHQQRPYCRRRAPNRASMQNRKAGFRDQARRQRRQSGRRDAQGLRQPDGLRGGDLALQQEPASSEDRDRQVHDPAGSDGRIATRERHHGKRRKRFRPLDGHCDLGPARAGRADAGDLGKHRQRGFHRADRRRRSLSPQGADLFLRARSHAGRQGGRRWARSGPIRRRFASSTSPAIRRRTPPATSNIPTSIRWSK